LYKIFLFLFKNIARPKNTRDTIIIEDSTERALFLSKKVNKTVNTTINNVKANLMCVKVYSHFLIVFNCFDGDLDLKYLYNK
jgi:hypothetical protein